MNTDFEKRDQLIFNKEIDWLTDAPGGVKRFEEMTLDTARLLIELGFLEKDECQNNSPTTDEIISFMEDNPKFTAHGYAVAPLRQDRRVTLEGVSFKGTYTKKTLVDFVDTFRDADDFVVNEKELHAWYD